MAAPTRSSRISRQIGIQFARIAFIYSVLAFIVVWQWHFVMTGIRSNIYLNGLIIGVFIFGSLEAIRFLFKLRVERVACEALEEVYRDAADRRKPPEGWTPLQIYERCFRPAHVFRSPRILGHAYDFLVEQLGGRDTSQMSISTMHELLDTVDRRLVVERSLLGYLASLCIFLGLIGTFIGLMEMVGSVGGIIGSLANSDNAGPDTIRQLIKSLEAPLTGMALGFSSSLFGLFTSLVLGVVLRFTGRAAAALRQELEDLLARISRIEPTSQPGVVAVPSQPQAQVQGLAVAVMSSLRRSSQAVRHASDAIAAMADRQEQQTALLGETARQLEHLSTEQVAIRAALDRVDALRQDIAASADGSRRAMSDVSRLIDQRVTDLHGELASGLSRLREDAARLESAQAAVAMKIEAVGLDTKAQGEASRAALSASESKLRERIGEVSSAVTAAREAGEAERLAAADRHADVLGSFGRIGGRVDSLEARLTTSVANVDEKVTMVAGELGSLRDDADRQARALDGRVEALVDRLEAADHASFARVESMVASVEQSLGHAALQSRNTQGALETLAGRVQATFSGFEAARNELRDEAGRAAMAEAGREERMEARLAALAGRDAEVAADVRHLVSQSAASRDQTISAIRGALSDGFSEVAERLGESQARLAAALSSIAANQQETVGIMAGLVSQQRTTAEVGAVIRSLDDRLTEGFAEIARTLQGIVLTQVGIAREDGARPAVVEAQPLEDGPDGIEAISPQALRRLAGQATFLQTTRQS